MEENRRAAARARRVIVPAEHAHDVIKPIGAPKFLMAGGMGQADQAVIGWVGGIVAPAIRGRDRLARHHTPRDRDAIGAIEHAAKRQEPGRGRAIAFDFLGPHAAPPECGAISLAGEPKNPIRPDRCDAMFAAHGASS
jgi:hypothetical protein